MPTYEYDCLTCKSRFEVTRKFSETGGGTCPKCGAEGQRIYCAPHLVFKGPGFYVTDSRTEVDPEVAHRKKETEAAAKPADAAGTPAVPEKAAAPAAAEPAKPAGEGV
ncbi:MAG: FmdB family zinc ribbon protein [Dehalogenimonas sp.]|jgi:putative FmdB family regulatory protein|uniref:FmdB family zinc ribbon protein n=1 Tax=Candidatus Dehalogenimonas loeffleri TaxID=3127115 RepID=A0ABZ2J9H5_9CHLR|nr:FmdB family zinc ribbon protein [Dehalogenimonas sp.]